MTDAPAVDQARTGKTFNCLVYVPNIYNGGGTKSRRIAGTAFPAEIFRVSRGSSSVTAFRGAVRTRFA